MISLSPEAEAQVDRLIAYYEAKERVAAAINLLNALERAKLSIARTPETGLAAPRPYPSLSHHSRRWIIEGRYWISYSLTAPPVISGVFYVTADIPNRIQRHRLPPTRRHLGNEHHIPRRDIRPPRPIHRHNMPIPLPSNPDRTIDSGEFGLGDHVLRHVPPQGFIQDFDPVQGVLPLIRHAQNAPGPHRFLGLIPPAINLASHIVASRPKHDKVTVLSGCAVRQRPTASSSIPGRSRINFPLWIIGQSRWGRLRGSGSR